MSAVTGIIGDVQTGHAMQGAGDDQINGILRGLGILNAQVPQSNKDLQATTNNANADLMAQTEGAVAKVDGSVTDAQNKATDAAKTANAGLDPYSQAGSDATSTLLDLLKNPGNFGPQQFSFDPNADPGAQFRMQQGQQALERSAAAHGGSLGGGALKELANYSQGLASQEYQNAFNRWDTTRNTTLKSLATQMNGLQGLSQEGLVASSRQGQNTIDAAQYAGDRGIQGAQWTGNANINTARYTGDRSINTQNTVSQNEINLAQTNAAGQAQIGDIQGNVRLARQGVKNQLLGQVGKSADAFASGFAGGYANGGGFGGGFKGGFGGMFGLPAAPVGGGAPINTTPYSGAGTTASIDPSTGYLIFK
jgi:uncharacterized protein YjbJ (UPF0337 family)